MKLTPRIGNTSNFELYGLQIKRGETVTIRVYMENGDAADVYLCATRADFTEEKRPGESDETAINNGQELIDEGLILARIGAGAWESICGWANKMQIGPIDEQEYVEVQLKSDLPAGLTSSGTVYAGLAFRVSGTEADDTNLDGTGSIIVSGTGYSAINQTYTYSSPGILTAPNGSLLCFTSGYWYLENGAGLSFFYAVGGTQAMIPAKGWRGISKEQRLLPNPILTQGA